MVSTSRIVISLVRNNQPAFSTFADFDAVLYHQPEKMAKASEDMAERQENLERLKKQHGID
jgi:hypothetical protein